MEQIKIVSVADRLVTVDVEWANGMKKLGLQVPDVPVEDFDASYQYLLAYVGGVRQQELEAAATKAAKAVDPKVLATVGHTFDFAGNLLA